MSATISITRGLKRASWICSLVNQRLILIRDASSSMSGSKARDASAASKDLVNELAQPANKDGFSVGIADYNSSSKIVHKPEKATSLVQHMTSISTGGCTNITAGLEDALKMLETTPENAEKNNIQWLKPVVMLFSDGRHNTGSGPHDVAKKIKEKADLVTIAFGSDADEKLLKDLATSPQHFFRCSDGRELRAFLADVGATLTGTMSSGVNATDALANMKQAIKNL